MELTFIEVIQGSKIMCERCMYWNIPVTHRELLMRGLKSVNYKRLPKTTAPNFSSYCNEAFVISLHGEAGYTLGYTQYKVASPGQNICLRSLFTA